MIEVNDQSRNVSPKNGSYAGGHEVSTHQHYANSALNKNY